MRLFAAPSNEVTAFADQIAALELPEFYSRIRLVVHRLLPLPLPFALQALLEYAALRKVHDRRRLGIEILKTDWKGDDMSMDLIGRWKHQGIGCKPV
jgi:hypothetical protein